MGQIPKVTANTLKRIAGAAGKQYKKVPWHSTTLMIKPLLSIEEYIRTIRNIVKDCETPDGEYAIELLDFAVKVNTIAAYSFVEFPEDINDVYYIIYSSDLYETICSAINSKQLSSIKEAITNIVGGQYGC